MLGIIEYLDMVPPGKLKDYERLPFDPVEREGLRYIRGTQDEKVPLLAYMFGAKAHLGAGVKFNNRVHFIFGADEETLWRCINRYKEREEAPILGYSPDTSFPLINAEQGLLQLNLEDQNSTDLRPSGGSAFTLFPT